MKRVLVVAALSAAMIPMSAGAASAHAVSVSTPSGTKVQAVHSGNPTLPPHSGAFKHHVTCSVNPTDAAATFLGPAACS